MRWNAESPSPSASSPNWCSSELSTLLPLCTVGKNRAGVRQGCVLSPRLSWAVLEWGNESWKDLVGTAGFDFGDGLPRLLGRRLADDILRFTKSNEEARRTRDLLIAPLGEVGLILSAEKTVRKKRTVITTTEVQLPQHIVFGSSHQVQILVARVFTVLPTSAIVAVPDSPRSARQLLPWLP